MTTPSHKIKTALPVVVAQRLAKIKQANLANGDLSTVGNAQDRELQRALTADPMSWVIAILTYLDEQALKADRPSTRLQPALDKSPDGLWAASHFAITGLGKTPEEAYLDFDREWIEKRVAI